ncbi:MAG: hypothetical protein ACXWRE_09190 [Pseudobdellovibrionaceae bacterium]
MARFMIGKLFLILAATIASFAQADVKTSKAVGYTVLAPPVGVSASKAVGYTVVSPLPGVVVSKAVSYAVVSPLAGVTVSKAIAYAVVGPPPVQKQPSIFIMTQNKIKNSPPLTLNSVESLPFDLNSLIFTFHQN